MNKVPAVITTKDLDYLSDMFKWNYVASKKAKHFSNEVTDEEIKQELEKVYEMHKEICNTILGILG